MVADKAGIHTLCLRNQSANFYNLFIIAAEDKSALLIILIELCTRLDRGSADTHKIRVHLTDHMGHAFRIFPAKLFSAQARHKIYRKLQAARFNITAGGNLLLCGNALVDQLQHFIGAGLKSRMDRSSATCV